MGEVSDIGDLLHRAVTEKRRGWGKAILVGIVSAVTSVAGTAWTARGTLDRMEHDIDLLRQDMHYLREHVDSVEHEAIIARGEAQEVRNMLFAMKGGAPPLKP